MFKKSHELESLLGSSSSAKGGQDTTESVIGPSVHLEGNFNSSGNIVIGGSLSGGLTTSGDVRVLEGAKVQATVSATHVYVAGEVRGDVRANELLELGPTARLYGNIEVKVLTVAPGAILHGKCSMKLNGKVVEKLDQPTKSVKQPVGKMSEVIE